MVKVLKDKEKILQKVETIKKSVEQMKTDDIEENPEMALDQFQCECCGETKVFAGSLIYENFRLCNDCVLLAETSLALGKISDIHELMDKMEDKRFESIYNSIFEMDKNNLN